MKKISCGILAFLFSAFFATYPGAGFAGGQQEELQRAMKDMKREIRTTVTVENPGTITGTVKCSRVRHSGDAIVYIEKVGENKYDAPKEVGVIDQMNLVFIPHVLAVQKGTVVDFPNNDQVRHNVFSPPDCCNQFNLGTYDTGSSKSYTFSNSCEVPLLCNVHAEMVAYVVVFDNPYFSVTSRSGGFQIDNVPPGTYTLKTWHEKLKPTSQEITVVGGKTSDVKLAMKKRK